MGGQTLLHSFHNSKTVNMVKVVIFHIISVYSISDYDINGIMLDRMFFPSY